MTKERSMRRTVLCVIDDDGLRDLVCEVLEDEGVTAVQAVSGLDALELLGRRRVDAIILDLALRARDAGLFRAAQLKSPTLKRLPVVLLAADPAEAFGLGVDAVLLRPLALDDVVLAVRGALAAAPPVSPVRDDAAVG
jgi:CheY-like chemotaxis protein